MISSIIFKPYPIESLRDVIWTRGMWQGHDMIMLIHEDTLIGAGFISQKFDADSVRHNLVRGLKIDTPVHQAHSNLVDESTPLNIVLYGTPFQHRVWQVISTISWGQSKSYLQIAQAIGCEKSVRAVGRAVGQNPVSGFIGCHRIVSAKGLLQGFRWGIEMKKHLLQAEGLCFDQHISNSNA